MGSVRRERERERLIMVQAVVMSWATGGERASRERPECLLKTNSLVSAKAKDGHTQ